MEKDAVVDKMIVIGGSAGSLEVILKIVSKLPPSPYAAFVIVVHRRNDTDSILTNLLSSRTRITVKEVEDKEQIFPNHIYIAPADYHLLVEDKQTFSLDSSEKINYSRPSIDVTFESVAEIFKENTIAVLLSGANADGALGLGKVKQAGGLTIVQDPASADVGFMPQQAIQQNVADRIIDGNDIGQLLAELLRA